MYVGVDIDVFDAEIVGVSDVAGCVLVGVVCGHVVDTALTADADEAIEI